MSRTYKIVFYAAALGAFVFVFQGPLSGLVREAANKYLPCSEPIKYSLGTFDSRFGISQQDFLKAVSEASGIWEKASGKNLFEYDPNGALKINLIYDQRQQATVELQKLGISVSNDKASYDKLKAKYASLLTEYNKEKADLQKKVSDFQAQKDAYEQEVNKWNSQGGAPEADYERLNQEKTALDRQVADINKAQDSLNSTAKAVNALATTINQLVVNLNARVDKINSVGQQTDSEFEEGNYQSGPNGEEIDIYQFDNNAKLVRVLAHEFGHSLGLAHVSDPKAIMYYLNNGTNETPTAADMAELDAKCKIKQ